MTNELEQAAQSYALNEYKGTESTGAVHTAFAQGAQWERSKLPDRIESILTSPSKVFGDKSPAQCLSEGMSISNVIGNLRRMYS